MLITGQYLYKWWKKAIGSAYTGYWSPIQWNSFFESSLIDCVERRFESSQDMKFKDEMATVIKTNVVVSGFGNNSINLRPIPIFSLSRTGTSWTLTTNVPFSPLSSNMYIYISGCTGFITGAPNGRFPITGFNNTIKGCTGVEFTAPISTGGPYNAYSGSFCFENVQSGSPINPAPQIIDYIHLLNIKCKFSQPLYSPQITSSTNGTPIVVGTNFFNKLSSSNWKDNPIQGTMSGWSTNTAANGTFYIKKLNHLQFALYTDIYLQNPVVGTANETNNNVSFSLVYYNNASKYLSTQKANSLIVPSWDKPGYERAGRQLNIYPMNIYNQIVTTPCTEVTMDYICNPQLPYVNDQTNEVFSGTYVDANNNTFDLTTIYSEKFLYAIATDMALTFVQSTRDMNLNEIAIQNIQANP